MNILSCVLYVLCSDHKNKSKVSTEEALVAFLAMAELGSSKTKIEQLASLSVLAEGSVSEIMIRLADKVFGVLINLLNVKHCSVETVRYAVVAMVHLSKTQDVPMCGNEAVTSLVPLASCDDRETKVWLVALLCKISFTEDAAVTMCQSGGMHSNFLVVQTKRRR